MNTRRLSFAPRLAGLVLAAAATTCSPLLPDPGRDDRIANGVVAMSVTIDPAATRGTLAAPLPFSAAGAPFLVHIEARGADNAPRADFNEFVTVSVSPGVLVGVEGANAYGRSVRLTNGAADVTVRVARSYGETRIFAEDNGYSPAPPEEQSPACADNADDDGDERTDFPADYGCAAPNDQTERGGSYAIAGSEPIYFAEPRLYDIQGGAATSPLLDARINVGGGPLVVTRISTSGFWVTDIGDRSCGGQPCFNSIFAFNFSTPPGMRVCDVLSQLQGSVQEFVGTTQLNQPSWLLDPARLFTNLPGTVCPIPPAVPIMPAMLMDAQTQLEPYESAIVRATSVTLARNIGPGLACDAGGCGFAPGNSNCDLNSSGAIEFDNAGEASCANTCAQTVGCSEWTNWRRFGQLAVDFPSGQPMGVPRLVIAPRLARPSFDPQRIPADLQGPVTVTGTLKQVGPNWIVEPRCGQDLHPDSAGTPPEPARSCVFPRTVTEEPSS